ncbi:FdtA/QdtA family cupin domain-containing protein [Orbaceae bacterium ac157xtp]
MKVNIIQLSTHGDERGSLISIENNRDINFDIKRAYYIFDTKIGVRRGFHAHKKLKQLLVVVSGSCRVLLDNGKDKKEVLLDRPDQGLVIDSLIWREMFDFSHDCVLMVLADQFYDESDYIRDYEKFISYINNKA